MWSQIYKKVQVIINGKILSITDKEKAELLGKAFASVHGGGDHLDNKHKQIFKENRDVYIKKDIEESAMDAEIQ